jgi:hypothetical protein
VIVNKFKDQNERRKFYKAVDDLKKGFQPRSNSCRNKDGEIIWEEHFKGLPNIAREEEGRETTEND